MRAKKYIIFLFVLFITPIVISEQSNVRRNSRGRIPYPQIQRTHEGAFALALKDPNVYIGVFEHFQADTKLPSGKSILSLPNVMEAMNKFRPLVCVKSIKGTFAEPIIWYNMVSAPIGGNRNSSFILLPGGKCILAVKKTTKEEITGRFGQEMKKYSYINENTFFDVLWYGYGALYLKWPEERKKTEGIEKINPRREAIRRQMEGRDEHEGMIKVPESMVDDLEAIAKAMPSIQKTMKDPNDTAAINKMSLSLKNDLAKSILEKVTSEKEEVPQRQGFFITN